jgi:hypothetical protein
MERCKSAFWGLVMALGIAAIALIENFALVFVVIAAAVLAIVVVF